MGMVPAREEAQGRAWSLTRSRAGAGRRWAPLPFHGMRLNAQFPIIQQTRNLRLRELFELASSLRKAGAGPED